MSNTRKRSKLPQYIVNAVRRRARAAEQWQFADDKITAYCERLGLDSEYIRGAIHAVVETDPDFFIRDLEACLEKLHKEE